MIIKVKQIISNEKNKFEITVNDTIKYRAGTPWMNLNLPLNIQNTIPCIITQTDESICYISSYDVTETFSNNIIPMKWAFTGSKKNHIYNIYDAQNNAIGKCYKQINGFLDSKYIIEYANYFLQVYNVSVGKTQHLPIYKDNIQIAEIVKSLAVTNNLDCYYIYLLDEYSNLETIISFFTVLFDQQKYPNSGEVAIQKEDAVIQYTYDKNNKFYDKHWINNHFNKVTISSINNQIETERKKNVYNIKKYALVIIALFIAGWIILLTIFALLFFIL